MSQIVSGQYSYNESVVRLREFIKEQKDSDHFRSRLMLVGIEGLSNSGKSVLSSDLEKALTGDSVHCLSIEGDGFHQGKEKAMIVYREALKRVEKGHSVPDGFINSVWRYDEMGTELLQQCRSFNETEEESLSLHLNNVLTNKQDSSEHTEVYWVSKKTVLLVPSMYLRHLGNFDFIIHLMVSPETSIQRKIKRTENEGYKRDPEITSKMVELIEYPLMLEHVRRNPLNTERVITMDTNDFENILLVRGNMDYV